MTSDAMRDFAYGMPESFNAGHTAVEVVRAFRRHDHQAVNRLTANLDATDLAALCGALAALVNATLNVCDDVISYANRNGLTELTQTSDDVLAVMAAGMMG